MTVLWRRQAVPHHDDAIRKFEQRRAVGHHAAPVTAGVTRPVWVGEDSGSEVTHGNRGGPVRVMDRRTRHLDRYVDALLGDRRPSHGAPDPDDLDALAAAIDLVSARPQAGMPRPRFVERLEARLREQTQGEFRRGPEMSRRGLLRAGGLAAASAAAGVVTERLVSDRASAPSSGDLAVDGGRWHGIATVDAVPVGRALRFSTAAVEGVVVDTGGGYQAMMAICTHLGCTLQLDGEHRRLDCPCGEAAFGLRGEVLVHPAAQRLRPLPRIPTRVRDGIVEVHIA